MKRLADMSRADVALWAIVCIGVLLRVRALWFNRSLWMDEALLANNLRRRDFLGLLRPLDDAQTAPLWLLWSGEAMSRVFGFAEWSLRLPAFVGGIVALAATALLARATFESMNARVVTVAAATLSATAVYFSAEFKPYSWDLAAGAIIAWLGVVAMRRGDVASITWLGAATCACLLISVAAVFAAGGTFLVVCVNLLVNRRVRALAWFGATAVAACGVFAAHYVLVLRHAGAETELFTYWQRAFPPTPFSSAGVGWLVGEAPSIVAETLGVARPRLALFAMVAGAGWMAWRRPWLLAIIAMPALLVYVAGAAERYPLYPRLLMVLAPAGFVLAGAAVALVAALRIGRPMVARIAAAALSVVLLADMTLVAAVDALAPPGREELRDVLETLAKTAEPGDQFYVHAEAGFAYDFYVATRPELDLQRTGPVVVSRNRSMTSAEIAGEVAPLIRNGRAWIVYSHMVYRPGEVEAEVRTLLDAQFAPFAHIEMPGATAEGWASSR